MFWQEEEDLPQYQTAADAVLDLSFMMQCKRLPLDHAWELAAAVSRVLPWLPDEPLAGVHSIHVAESGNGWLRPSEEDQEAWLIPSKRTRLELRLPKYRIADAQALSGQTLYIADQALVVGTSKEKTFLPVPVLFARAVLSTDAESEEAFLQRMAAEIEGITATKVKKMLCGKRHYLQTPDGKQLVRHLMIADLDAASSLLLQQQGLGAGRFWGCGLLLPHKGIKTLKASE